MTCKILYKNKELKECHINLKGNGLKEAQTSFSTFNKLCYLEGLNLQFFYLMVDVMLPYETPKDALQDALINVT